MSKDLYIIFGPPGSGKTTQAKFLAKSFHLFCLSWGSIDRNPNSRNKYSSQFKLIDDISTSDTQRSKTIAQILDSEISENKEGKGIVLDGFPRRLEEAKLLISICKKHDLKLKAVIKINPSLQAALNRFNHRFICPKCKVHYDSELNPSEHPNTCDIDGTELRMEQTSRKQIEDDFLSYLDESETAYKYLSDQSQMSFDVSGDDEDIVVHSNILMKLRAHEKSNFQIYQRQSSSDLQTKYGNFKMISYLSRIDYVHQLAIVKGEVQNKKDVLVRVHSSCITGDIFGSEKCDCGDQLHKALRMIEKEGEGVVIYLFQEGRGINIVNKLMAYDLQSKGLDTVEANEKLKFPAEMRRYEAVKDILDDLQIKSVNLITNNPDKVNKLTDLGVVVQDTTSLEIKPGKYNSKYLKTKKEKMGHRLTKV